MALRNLSFSNVLVIGLLAGCSVIFTVAFITGQQKANSVDFVFDSSLTEDVQLAGAQQTHFPGIASSTAVPENVEAVESVILTDFYNLIQQSQLALDEINLKLDNLDSYLQGGGRPTPVRSAANETLESNRNHRGSAGEEEEELDANLLKENDGSITLAGLYSLTQQSKISLDDLSLKIEYLDQNLRQRGTN